MAEHSKMFAWGSVWRFSLGSLAACVIAGAAVSPANALLVSVNDPLGPSNLGTAAAIVGAPTDALDDIATNTGMEAFNEAQAVITSVAHAIDGGGSIAAGTRVDSHMIFLNSAGGTALNHFGVEWTFDAPILGVMSDSGGTFEAASTFELGNPGTNYTVTFLGSGPAAPFAARGMEGSLATILNLGGLPNNDGYAILNPFTIRVGMNVTEPGDWIRVVTAHVPVPAAAWMFLTAIAGLFGFGWVRKRGAAAA